MDDAGRRKVTNAELWRAPDARLSDAAITRFMAGAEERAGTPIPDFWALHRWSVAEPELFWPLAWEFCGLAGTPGAPALIRGETQRDWRFFPEARLNVVDTLLKNADDRPALIATDEGGARRTMSRAELRQAAARLAGALEAAGIGPGEHVAGFLPNGPEAVIGLLACAWIGAVWSSCSPELGADVVVDRFGQIEPKMLIGATAYGYGGKHFDISDRLMEIAGRIPSIRQVVVTGDTPPDGAHSLEAFQSGAAPAGAPVALPFAHPLYVLFSSGTTGKPKCIEHAAGGALLRQMVEQQLHGDLRAGDVMFYFATTSWMMWNWLVAGLASEAAIVLFDGNPMHPGPERLFDMAEAEGVTHFGTAAKFIAAVEKAGLVPRESHDLSALRVIWSTGSPLAPAGFDHVYRDWKTDVQLASISGGTDIVGCFVGGAPSLPVHRGEIPGPILGVDATVVSDTGEEVLDQAGELICRQPHPSMPNRFVNDPGGARYRDAYFDKFPGWWRQGDFAIRRATGGVEILGRSDATLNPGGVRIGTAEIYRQIEAMPEIADSMVVGQRTGDDMRVVLFIVPAEGRDLDDELAQAIRTRLRRHASPRHVPAAILEVPDIPRTRSGKIAELAVRDVVNGQQVRDVAGLANPEMLDHFRDRPELTV